MSRLSRFFSVSLLVMVFAMEAFAQEALSILRQDQKTVQVTAYAVNSTSCRGIAIISPGAGGSEKGLQYLGDAMSSLGYLAVVVGHQESGRLALREFVQGNGLRDGLSELITDPSAYRGRLLDIAAAKEWAGTRCSAPESVLIGHSMGAATTMIEAGARNKLGLHGSDAFSAYIALSPQGEGSIFLPNAWADIKYPVLSLTGTRDDEVGGNSWEVRTAPYLNMPAGCKWLGVVEGATHRNFAGNGMSRRTEALTTQVIASFLDGVKRADCSVPKQIRGMNIQSK